MKIKKKSIIIPAFALLIGASLAGSISGTVAWYQYSTRVNAAYVGVSGGTSGNLQMRLRDGNYNAQTGDWMTRLSISDIQNYLANTAEHYGSELMPITSGAMAKDDALPANFYLNPIYGVADYADWAKASEKNYVVIPLQLRYVERDGNGDPDAQNVAKEVFLTELLIQEDHTNDANDKEDLSDAIRFHISSYSEATPTEKTNRLISKRGGTTEVEGALDLDGDGALDTEYVNDKYGFEGNATQEITYGAGRQISFSNGTDLASNQLWHNSKGEAGTDEKVYPMVAESDGLDIVDANKEYDNGKSKSIGSTLASTTQFLNVDITIWVEGWQSFENAEHEYSSIWSEDYMNSKFNVGFEFAIDTVIE